MASENAILDPDTASVELNDAPGSVEILEVDYTPPAPEIVGATSIAVEGTLPAARKLPNRTITCKVKVYGATMRARLLLIEQKVGKLSAEGGVWRRVLPDESFIDFDVVGCKIVGLPTDRRFVQLDFAEVTIEAECKPLGRGERYNAGTFTFAGSPLPVLDVVVEDVPGTARALADVRLTSPDDQWRVRWGWESRQYSDADTAQPYYPAQDLTPLDGATTTTATIQGVSVPVIRQGTLTPNWRPVHSTELAAGGHLTHAGIYEILVWLHLPTGNTGQVEVKLEYGAGTRRTENAALIFPVGHDRAGELVLVSLGQVFLRPASQGPHHWIGTVAARSTIVGDDIDIAHIGVIPVAEGNGTVSAEASISTPLSVAIRDEFDQASGNLHGKSIAAAASVSGPRNPGTAADDAGTGSLTWANPSSVLAEDGALADTSSGGSPGISHYLKATNFGFSLPVGATVDGIVAEIKRGADGLGDQIVDNHIFLVKAGAIQGVGNHAAGGLWPAGALIYRSYGSPNDLWSNTWTQAQINASGFGIAISASMLNGSRAQIDHVRVTVYYTAATGQTWATTGDATDIAVEATGHTAQRGEVSDADTLTGRYAVAGTNTFSDVVVSLAAKRSVLDVGSSQQLLQSALARYTDANNWLMGGYLTTTAADFAFVGKRVAGTYETLGAVAVPSYIDWRTIWLHADRLGRYWLWGVATGGLPRLLLAGRDTSLILAATLASGKVGFYDAKTGATAVTRNYDNVAVWVPPRAAVLFSDCTLELGSSSVERESLGGGAASGVYEPLVPRGDYMRLEPAGVENRKNRLAIVASPSDPDLMGVPATPSDLEADIFVTPRYYAVPDPA